MYYSFVFNNQISLGSIIFFHPSNLFIFPETFMIKDNMNMSIEQTLTL